MMQKYPFLIRFKLNKITYFLLELEKYSKNQNENDGRGLGHRVQRDRDVFEAPLR